MNETASQDLDIEALERVLEKFEKDEHVTHAYHRTLNQRVEHMLRFYKDRAVNQMRGSKELRDDMLVYLRAMSMIVSQAENAGTHGEKNARLRGVIEMCETAISQLRKEEFNFNSNFYWREDIFRSDYPVRYYIDKIHTLEHKLQELVGNPKDSEKNIE